MFTTNAAYNLTVGNTTSPSYTLKVMTVVAVIFFPVVLVYQGWTYHVFRGRLSAPRVGTEVGAGDPDTSGEPVSTVGPTEAT